MGNRKIEELEFDCKQIVLNETLFNTANGYIGIRGNYEEDVPKEVKSVRGTYINAFYDTEAINYEEKFTGYAEYNQTILNVIDAQTIELFIDKERFSLFDGEILNYRRCFDLDNGLVSREVYWRSPKGHEFKIRTERLASFHTLELFAIRYVVESINYSGNIKIASLLNGNVSNISSEDDPRLRASSGKNLIVSEMKSDNNLSYITCQTKRSDLGMACSVSHYADDCPESHIELGDDLIKDIFVFEIQPEKTVTVDKFTVYTDSRRYSDFLKKNIEINNKVFESGFDFYKEQQKTFLTDFWDKADVEIEGDEKLQEGIRFNIFQLLQSVGKDKWSNIAAKGLSGEGYEGHYFWDTEIYIFPLFLYTDPEFAKNLLLFRYNTLDAARKRAGSMSHLKGALYPWRTINGDECSGFFPAGTAQYHINVDITYSIIQYIIVTEDYEFLANYGAEILFEIARVMYDTGVFDSEGRFCINGVTGPDEYTCIVNNNYYTNVMTKYLFNFTKKAWDILASEYADKLEVLKNRILISIEEIKEFYAAAEFMYLPYDEKLKIHPQDDSFLQKKVWDLSKTPKEKFPLLLHYHPLVLYRYQVCKQADAILGHFLREEETTIDIIKNDFEYYEKITTHDSSLSTCIFSIIASRIGKKEKAYDYFMHTARTDLDNLHGNSQHGIHTACMGGAWISIVFGFAGMRVIEDKLHFRPSIPKSWNKLSFKISFKGRKLKITITDETDIAVKLISGKPINLFINDKEQRIGEQFNIRLLD